MAADACFPGDAAIDLCVAYASTLNRGNPFFATMANEGNPDVGIYEIDTMLQLTGTFADALTGQLADPTTITLYLQPPTGVLQTITGGSLTRISTGVYTYTFTASISGAWSYKWQGTGAVVVTSPDTKFTVNPSTLVPG
jgi:hypothetical protein